MQLLLLDHLIKSVLYLLPALKGDLPLSMLDKGNTRAGPDGIGTRHIPYSIKEGWESPLQGNYVLDCSGGAREVTLFNFTLREGLVFKSGI